jgi:cell division inhibitor SepF
MGALRKAGVWLGLIEDEDDRGYDGHGYDDDFEDEVDEAPVPVRPRAAVAERLAEAREAGRAERTAVRPIGPSEQRYGRSGGGTSGYPTRDNLALAPQVQLRERAVVAEEQEERRYQITTLHPTTYNEARTIGEHFRDGVPVIMNLTEMAEADAKRLVDFAAGLAFGLRGTMERVTNRVFLLSPANVQVTAEDKARIAEGGFFNQS